MERNPYDSPYETRYDEPVPETPEPLSEEPATRDLLVASDTTDDPLNTDDPDHDRLDADNLDHNPVNTDVPDVAEPDEYPESPGTADEIDFDARWHDIKAGFVDDPRDSVEKADALIDEAVNALAARRQALVDGWKNQNDTEQLRLAMREYRSLFDKLKG